MAKLADASDLGSDGKPYGFESLRLHHRRRKANSATAPRISGSCLLLHLTSPLRVATMQDVHSLLFFRFVAKLSLVHSFSLRGSGFRRRLIQAREFLCREGTPPPVADALIPQPKSMILPGDPLYRPARRVQIRCRQFAVPSSLLSSLRVPSTAPLRNNTNQNAK